MRVLMIAPEPFFQPRGAPISVFFRLQALSRLQLEVDLLTYHLGEDVHMEGVRIWFRANFYPMFLERTVTSDMATNFSLYEILKLLWNPLAHHGRVILRANSMGAIWGFFSLLGILFLICRGQKGGRLIGLTSLSFIFISDLWLRSYAEPRHLNVIYPFLALGAVAFVDQAME